MIIGILGPLDSALRIQKYLQEIDSGLEIRLYTKEKIAEAIDLIEQCESECNGIILTGCGIHEVIIKNYEIKKPHSFVERSDTSILKAFWEMHDLNIDIDKFSIDVVEKDMVETIIDEFEIKHDKMYCLPFSTNINEDSYLDWHMDLYISGKTKTMITGFMNIYNQLKEKDYPIFLLKPTRSLVKAAYDEVMGQYAINKAENSQIAVEIFNFGNSGSNIENYYSNMLKKADMDKYIATYVRSINGAVFPFGRNEYIIFSNKGAVNKNRNYEKLLQLQKEIKTLGFSLSIGIGFGSNAFKAEINASKALERGIDSKENYIYSIDEEENLTGPLGLENEMSYCIVPDDKSILELSEKSGLSCETISKIMGINEIRGSKIYDSKELAGYLDISDRSARRILQKITTADLGKVHSKESSKGAGRPKNLIEILF
ncbi:transcriptional regulator [Paraclostridium bifermentans]|uniref:transcriptional regulator n=1 Tax=Paraclostridium bifermentans TaxID=1490 RepID=UPI00374FC333